MWTENFDSVAFCYVDTDCGGWSKKAGDVPSGKDRGAWCQVNCAHLYWNNKDFDVWEAYV